MVSIKAVYKIPSLKHIFFIASSDLETSKTLMTEGGRKTRMGYFEHILLSKDHTSPKPRQLWTTRLLFESDLLWFLERQKSKQPGYTSQSCTSSESLELLAINLLKIPQFSPENPFCSPKVLGKISDADIIEVTI